MSGFCSFVGSRRAHTDMFDRSSYLSAKANRPPVTAPTIAETTTNAMKPTTQVATALPVVKSSACLTAITIAMRLHIITTKARIPPRAGMKLRIARALGESEAIVGLEKREHGPDRMHLRN